MTEPRRDANMDRSALERRLAEAEQRVARVERQIAEQRKVVAELDPKVHVTDHARYLLAGLELLLSDRQSSRDALLKRAKGST